ncbi:sensor domain-containing diguanylate cyclase [Oceanispirochaeta sp.]|jgi:diguanylate cyclase (GGDEF)-like protein/PAS domain S-box-containing protein|uniref:GGDEF domain-containing protein n=1 Tax=Oceanispirochaeta sp. TaxID=2035350 RepID=UPI00262A6D89|nr:sensor domain-containing diguanylate cyclase [Oceanispirochaeta sp.]MDA3958510.1 diguanylate cyclase [Oceanispirochaeta sp.]
MPLGPSGDLPIRVFRQSLSKLGVFLHNYLTGETFPNDLWYSWGYSDSDLAENLWLKFVHPDDVARVDKAMKEISEGKTDLYDEIYRIKTKSGEYRWLYSSGNFISRSKDSSPGLYLGADRDITELKQTEQRLSQALKMAQDRSLDIENLMAAGAAVTSILDYTESIEMVLEKSQQVICYDYATVQLLKEDNLVVVGSRGWVDNGSILGVVIPLSSNYPNTRVVQEKKALILNDFSGFDNSKYPLYDESHSSWIGVPLVINNKVLGLLSCNRKDSRSFESVHLEMAIGFAVFISIALNNADLHEEMRHLANTDSLTSLHTRRWFYDSGQRLLDQSVRHKWPLTVMMMDLDDFKRINDNLGHQMGDHVLVAVSKVIENETRKSDLLCRYGGEEFSIILPETDFEYAKIFAERVRTHIEELHISNLDQRVTISIGMTVSSAGGGIEIDALMSRADEALYHAKNQGKNKWVCL